MGFKSSHQQSVENNIADIEVDVLSITEDSLKVILLQHIQKIGKKKDLLSYVSLSVALIIVLVTADFKNFIFKPDTWYGIFIVLTLISVAWTIKAIKENTNIDDNNAVENLIIEIKKTKSHVSYGAYVSSSKINSKIDKLTSDLIKSDKNPSIKKVVQISVNNNPKPKRKKTKKK